MEVIIILMEVIVILMRVDITMIITSISWDISPTTIVKSKPLIVVPLHPQVPKRLPKLGDLSYPQELE
jgi:hypothetical protein